MPEIPCPRLAGATFTAEGRLIYFHNFSFPRGQSSPPTYEGLLKFMDRPVVVGDSANEETVDPVVAPYLHSISSFYYTEESSLADLTVKQTPAPNREILNTDQSRPATAPRVLTVDVSNLIILDRKLVTSYRIFGESSEAVCAQNAHAARAQGREDLYKAWLVLATITKAKLFALHPQQTTVNNSGSNRTRIVNAEPRPIALGARRHASMSYGAVIPPKAPPVAPLKQSAWALHPFTNQLVESLFSHYQRLQDVQTLALFTCALSLPPNLLNLLVRLSFFVFCSSQGRSKHKLKPSYRKGLLSRGSQRNVTLSLTLKFFIA